MSRVYRNQAEWDNASDDSPRDREKARHAHEMSCDWAGRCPRCARDTRVYAHDKERLARPDPELCNPCYAAEPTWKPSDTPLFLRSLTTKEST